jgi:HlyD family secretion protein
MTFHAARSNVRRPSVSLITSRVSRNSRLRELKNGKPRQIAARPFVLYARASPSNNQRRVALAAGDEHRMTDVKESPAPEDRTKAEPQRDRPTGSATAAAAIVTLIVAGIVGLSVWCLARPQPLIVQGEADATRIDIAARVDGRVGKRPVERGQNVAAGQLLFEIDNPELITKWRQAQARVDVAKAQLANILVGTRVEVVDQKKAALESAQSNFQLADKTYARIKDLAGTGNAPLQRLDEVTNTLEVARREQDSAQLAYN